MEEMIKRILEVDEQAEAYRAKNLKERESEISGLEAERKKINDEFEDKLSAEKKDIRDEVMKKASEEVKSIIAGRSELLGNMQAGYEVKAEALVEALFGELKEKMKEG